MNIFELMVIRFKFKRAKKRSAAFAQSQLKKQQKPPEHNDLKPKKYAKFGFRM